MCTSLQLRIKSFLLINKTVRLCFLQKFQFLEFLCYRCLTLLTGALPSIFMGRPLPQPMLRNPRHLPLQPKHRRRRREEELTPGRWPSACKIPKLTNYFFKLIFPTFFRILSLILLALLFLIWLWRRREDAAPINQIIGKQCSSLQFDEFLTKIIKKM